MVPSRAVHSVDNIFNPRKNISAKIKYSHSGHYHHNTYGSRYHDYRYCNRIIGQQPAGTPMDQPEFRECWNRIVLDMGRMYNTVELRNNRPNFVGQKIHNRNSDMLRNFMGDIVGTRHSDTYRPHTTSIIVLSGSTIRVHLYYDLLKINFKNCICQLSGAQLNNRIGDPLYYSDRHCRIRGSKQF